MTSTHPLPTATIAETLGVLTDVVAPNLAKGVILRRPGAVALADRLELDRRAVRRMQRLRDRYGSGPLMLRIPVRSQAIVLDPAHLRRVLDESPEPFSTASSEKRAALSHFEPKGALITPPGPERDDRRRFNEQVLQADTPVHRLAERFVGVVREEGGVLIDAARRAGVLDWPAFSETWFRVVRRVVFGDGARDDRALREMIDQLRAHANWAFLRPKDRSLRERFFARMNEHLARAEPGSLAQVMASIPKRRGTAADHQVPQWLFAFDPAGMTTFRSLALLAAHPLQAARADAEIERQAAAGELHLPLLRACILESLRLWPTTPLVLRQSTRETSWEAGVMPADTGVMLFAPFFHRDDARLPFADRFEPELWLEAGKVDQAVPPREWPLIPFSGGPAICPGRNLVLLLTSQMLALLTHHRTPRLVSPDRLDPRRLPATLNHFDLRFVPAA
jgi:cytochrome P450